jgi:hypothetical protein
VDIVNGVPDEYVVASTKVLGADQFTEFERQVRSTYDQMARISIEPVWAPFASRTGSRALALGRNRALAARRSVGAVPVVAGRTRTLLLARRGWVAIRCSCRW